MSDKPQSLTVNGEGLLAWGKRTDCHIYRMIHGENGIYTIFLIWLDGRTLTDIKGNPYKPMRGESQFEAMKANLGEMGK